MKFGALEVSETDVKKNGVSVATTTDVAAALAAAAAAAADAATALAAIAALAPIASSGSAADLTTGIIPDARMPNLTGDVTTVEGAVATTLAGGAASALTDACVAYSTAKLDWRATSAGNALIPAKAGFYFCPVRYEMFADSQTGSDPTGTLTFSVGNNVNENNLVPSTSVTAASIRPAAPPLPSVGGATNSNITSAEATTGYTFKITAALGTSTTFTGRFVIYGRWLPV